MEEQTKKSSEILEQNVGEARPNNWFLESLYDEFSNCRAGD